MATRRKATAADEPPQPMLQLPLQSAQTAVRERIDLGRALLSKHHAIQASGDLGELRSQYYTWSEFNESWLRRFVGATVADQYRGISIGGAYSDRDPLQLQLGEYDEDVTMHVRRLESILERLPLWVNAAMPDTRSGEVVGLDAPVFIVHGHDLARAQLVARVVERSTGRDAVVLHEQPNQGKTLLEKFEAHASRAAFAVVLLTADDEGRKRGDEHFRHRGRQNVIFELGFFFGALGRGRVLVLVDRDVEHPSDVAGLVYEVFDNAGSWKQAMARELTAAGIEVDHTRIP